MTTPHRGQRCCRALALLLLLTGAALATSTPQARASSNEALLADMLTSIEDVSQALDGAVMQGDMHDVRKLDKTLDQLIRSFDDMLGMQQHRHHHGGSFGAGTSQFSGGNSDGSSSSGSTTGDGSTQRHHHHHHGDSGAIGRGMQGLAGGSSGSSSTGSTRNSARSGVNSGINQVSTTINQIFNGPATVNINNGQQQITRGTSAGTSTTGSTTAGTSFTTTTAAGTTGTHKKTTTGTSGSGPGTTSTTNAAAGTSPSTTTAGGTTGTHKKMSTSTSGTGTGTTTTAKAGSSKTGVATAGAGTGKSAASSAGAAVSKAMPTASARNTSGKTQGATLIKSGNSLQAFAHAGKMSSGTSAVNHPAATMSGDRGTQAVTTGHNVNAGHNFNAFVGARPGAAHIAAMSGRRR
jgi:hypothetical protein